jgi:hypothetical protein
MASTFSALKIELPGTGEQAGTWGVTTNTNLGTALQQAIVGKATLVTGDFTADSYTLPYTDSNADQDFRALVLDITATLTGAGTVIVPDIEKPYIVFNNSVGGFAVTVKISGGAGISVPNGKKMILYNTGSGGDVISAVDYFAAIETASLTAATADINGGTIDGATIGGNNAAAGTFTTATATTGNITTVNATTVNATTFDTNVAAAGATLSGTTLAADGTDSNISLTMTPKGTGEVVTATWLSGIFSDRVSALGNSGTSTTITATNGTVFTSTLTGNCTFTVASANGTASRATSFTLILTNDGTAGRSVALSGGTFKFPNGALARTTTANAIDIWFFFSPDGGTTWYVSIPMKALATGTIS